MRPDEPITETEEERKRPRYYGTDMVTVPLLEKLPEGFEDITSPADAIIGLRRGKRRV
jgi:hypothetical protein